MINFLLDKVTQVIACGYSFLKQNIFISILPSLKVFFWLELRIFFERMK